MSTTPQVFPVFTKKWHSKPYEALSVTRPEVSAKGKNIVITGGGSGIGAATAIAFAKAGAKSVGIVGRREGKLVESKNAIEALGLGTKVEYAVADIVSATEVPAAFEKFKTAFGPIDILISNAGYLNASAPAITVDVDDWWKTFEINVKGLLISARAFFAVASEAPTLLYTSTVMATIAAMPGASAYAASKIAASRVIEYLAAENPKLFTLNIHPGVVETELSTKGGVPHMDDVELPAAFYVWAASPEAKFLNGKFAWVNWDVEELKARATEISGSSVLTLTLDGPKYGA